MTEEVEKLRKQQEQRAAKEDAQEQLANEKRDILFKEMAKNVKGGEATLKEIRESKKVQEDTKQKMNDFAEAQGLTLDEFKKSVAGQEMQFKIDQEEKRAKKLTDAKDLSMRARQFALSARQLATFEGMKNAFSGLSETLLKIPGAGAVVGATRSLFGVLKNLALIALIPLLVKFLNSQTFKDMANYLLTNGVKIIEKFEEAVIGIFKSLEKITKAFIDDGFLAGFDQAIIELNISTKEDLEEFKKNIKQLAITSSLVLLGSGLALVVGTVRNIGMALRNMAGVRGAGNIGAQVSRSGGAMSVKDRGFKAGQTYDLKDESGTERQVKAVRAGKSGLRFQDVESGKFIKTDTVIDQVIGGQGILKLKSGSRFMKFLGMVQRVSKFIPMVGRILAINDLINIYRSGAPMKEKVTSLVGLMGGLSGAALGALLGGAVGGVVPLVGNLIGGVGGGIFGYMKGDQIATGLAQWMLGGPVTALEDFMGFNLNKILNSSAGALDADTQLAQATAGSSSAGGGNVFVPGMADILGLNNVNGGTPYNLSVNPAIKAAGVAGLEAGALAARQDVLGFRGIEMAASKPTTIVYNYATSVDNSSSTTAVNGNTPKVNSNPYLFNVLER